MTPEDHAALAREFDDLAGGWGVPAAVQVAVDHLPDSATADVAYHFSIGIGLLLGDLAAVLETDPTTPDPSPTTPETPAATPGGGSTPLGRDRGGDDTSTACASDVGWGMPADESGRTGGSS